MMAGSSPLLYGSAFCVLSLGIWIPIGDKPLWQFLWEKFRRKAPESKSPIPLLIPNGVIEMIGNTPLIRLPSLSMLTGCEILV
jgi:hypothetical protein